MTNFIVDKNVIRWNLFLTIHCHFKYEPTKSKQTDV